MSDLTTYTYEELPHFIGYDDVRAAQQHLRHYLGPGFEDALRIVLISAAATHERNPAASGEQFLTDLKARLNA